MRSESKYAIGIHLKPAFKAAMLQASDIVGIAVAWNAQDVYYISLSADDDVFSNISNPVNIDYRIKSLKEIFELNNSIIAFRMNSIGASARSTHLGVLNLLAKLCISITSSLVDLSIANWLLYPEELNALKNIEKLAEFTVPGLKSASFCKTVETNDPIYDTCLETALVWHIAPILMDKLQKFDLLQAFKQVEMPLVPVIAAMEDNGLGFDSSFCTHIATTIQARMALLQEQAYHLAGKSFALTNPKQVSKILFEVLNLKVSVIAFLPILLSHSKPLMSSGNNHLC